MTKQTDFKKGIPNAEISREQAFRVPLSDEDG